MNVPWTAACAAAIGVDWLLEAIAPGGAFGRRSASRQRAYRRGEEAAARAAVAKVDRLARGADAARLASLRAAIVAAPDPGSALLRASGGGVLADVDFFELSRFLDALAEVGELAAPAAFADVDLPRGDDAIRRVLAPGRTAARSFYLDDAFDSVLAVRRAQAAAAQATYDAARSRIAARAARYAGTDHVRDGEFVVMRGRAESGLPPEIRILREAPTYLLCELVLDEAALEALATRDDAVAAVADAEEAVRARLSADVARASEQLHSACELLGALDVLVARAQFAQRYACVTPEVRSDNRVAFTDARYLPLADALKRRGRPYAPISLQLDGMGVVTGPNMGGKTAALRTLGFTAACLSVGVPVPAVAASVALYDDIVWLGLGTAPRDDGLLSAFGSEVVELRAFLERDVARPLVLVDEFARTTSPREGRALLVALLELLRERGAAGLAATHFAAIATDAGVAHYAAGGLGVLAERAGKPLDLDAALQRIARAMDYRIARVDENAVAASDAIALAGALGLDPALLARAKRAL